MKKTTSSPLPEHQGSYPKSWLMVLMAFIISLYILWPFPDEPFRQLIGYRWFWHSFWVISTISVAQVWSIFFISIWLDSKYHWEKQFYARLLGQLFIGWVIPVAVSLLISWFWFQYLRADIHSIRYAYNRYMFKAIIDIALILNFVYLACSIGSFLKRRLSKDSKGQTSTPFADHFYLQIPGGKEEIKVKVSEIAYFCHKNKGTLLRTHDGRAFIFWEPLNQLEKQLDPGYFCRVSRTYIITRKAVKSWQKHSDRGVILEVQPSNGESVKVSRDKTRGVVAWIKRR